MQLDGYCRPGVKFEVCCCTAMRNSSLTDGLGAIGSKYISVKIRHPLAMRTDFSWEKGGFRMWGISHQVA